MKPQYKAITFDIKGIKCDNCTWKDNKAIFDPDFYLGMPCPECGANLFTQKDYDAMKKMLRFAMIVNILAFPYMLFKGRKQKAKFYKASMNGTGNIYFDGESK